MTTLKLKRRRARKKKPKQVSFSPDRPYVDRGKPGPLRYGSDGKILRAKEPPPVPRVMLTMQLYRQLQRHNSLALPLQPTNRMLLRWGESEGDGLYAPDSDIREIHYDPLPPDLHRKVTAIVDGSPWETLTRKWYRTTLTGKELAALFCISRDRLYDDWRASLWYFRGRFEAAGIHE